MRLGDPKEQLVRPSARGPAHHRYSGTKRDQRQKRAYADRDRVVKVKHERITEHPLLDRKSTVLVSRLLLSLVVRIVVLMGLVCCVTSVGKAQRAAPALSYEVDARLDGDLLHVSTTVEVQSSSNERLRFWFYSDRLAEAPRAMNEHNARWIFPREVDLSSIENLEVEVDGHAASHRWVRGLQGSLESRDVAGSQLWVEAQPEVPHTVVIRFVQRIPERFGRLGVVGSRISLNGPWYPLLVQDQSYRFVAQHRVRFCSERTIEIVGFEPSSPGCHVSALRGSYLPVAMAERWHTLELTQGAARIRLWSHRPIYVPPSEQAPGVRGIRDISRIDMGGNMANVAAGIAETLRLSEVSPRQGVMNIVMTASRTELAGTAPGLVLVSDRIYEVLFFDAVRALHDRALARAFFRWHLAPRVNGIELPADRAWAEDLRAVVLTDLDLRRQSGELTTTQDLMSWAGFHPAVDQLLYAPQVAFTDALFGVVSEPDSFRESPERSFRPQARGRRILEHARDRLSEERLREWTQELLRLRVSARLSLEASERVALERWLESPTLPVNYRLGEVQTTREGADYVHRIEVFRDGSTRREPVTVRVEQRRGDPVDAVWDAEGSRGVVTIRTNSRRRRVEIDPRRRLPQDASLAGGHPLRDDTDRLRWRPPILQAFNFEFSTSGVFTGLLDFALRRRFDLENSVGLRLTTGPRSIGAQLRYSRGVGPKRDTNSRVGRLAAGLLFDRLRGGFLGGQDGGWRTGLVLSGVFSNQRFFLDPRSGGIAIGSLRAAVVRRDDGSVTYTLTPTVRGNITVPIGLRSALVLAAGGSYAFGQPTVGELPGLGSRFYLRGYTPGSLSGRGNLFAVAELRFTPTALSDLQINALHVAWIREIQLAVFAGGGVVASPRALPYGAEVGVGIRLHIDYAGILPAVFTADMAVPLVREAGGRGPPVTVFVAFQQYF